MEELNSSDAHPRPSRIPDEGCKAFQEALLRSDPGLKLADDCPVCARFGISCAVGCHSWAPPAPAPTATAPVMESVQRLNFPPPSRKRRWSELNAVLDAKAKEGKCSSSFSSITWEDVEDFLPITAIRIAPQPFDETVFQTLFDYIKLVNTSVKALEGKEGKRMLYIAPIIVAVCSTFDDVEILVEDDLVGKEIHSLGRFEMIIKRGALRICLVEAKKENMDRGLAQCLIGNEVVSELYKLDVVHGIITMYESWHLTSSRSASITKDTMTLSIENGMPDETSLRILVGKIRALLLQCN